MDSRLAVALVSAGLGAGVVCVVSELRHRRRTGRTQRAPAEQAAGSPAARAVPVVKAAADAPPLVRATGVCIVER
eukprot:3618374-Prymnesium_polylepis.1